jgi:hypothetical protein
MIGSSREPGSPYAAIHFVIQGMGISKRKDITK